MGDQPCCTAGFGPDGGPKKSPTPGSWAACSRAAARSACDRIVVCSAPSGSSSPRACHLACAVGCVASAAVGVACAYGGCWWRGGAAACWPGAADGGCAPAVGAVLLPTVAAVPTVAVRPEGDAVTPRHSALARLGVWERPGLVAAAREADAAAPCRSTSVWRGDAPPPPACRGADRCPRRRSQVVCSSLFSFPFRVNGQMS